MTLQKTVGDNGRNRLIAGSRNNDGNVPNVNWNDDKLKVNYCNPDNGNGNLRARAEVSKRSPMRTPFSEDILSNRPSFWIFLVVFLAKEYSSYLE